MDSLKYVKNFSAGDRAVEMLLYDQIGISTDASGLPVGIAGAGFAAEMDYLANREGVTHIKLRINSPGGTVIDGLSIIAATNRINQSGIAQVDTYIDGIAGSMAGVIAVFGKKRYAFDYARIMVHAPSDPDGGTPDEAIAQIRGMLSSVLTSQTKDDEINRIMSSGGDQWYTAKEAKKRGYIDEIVSTGREPISISASKSIRAVMADATKIIKSINSDTMDLTLIRAKLNISEAENMVTAIDSLVAKAKEADGLKAKNKELSDELEKTKNVVAESVVDAAIAAGKFDAKDRVALVVNAKAAPEAFAAIVKSTTTIANKVPLGGNGDVTSTSEVSENEFGVDAKGIVKGPGLPAEGLSFSDLDRKELSTRVRNAAPSVWQKAYNIEFGIA